MGFRPKLVASTILYVDKNRTDSYVVDGSIVYPYKTIQSAIDAVPTTGPLIPADDYRYEIYVVGGGYYDELLTLRKYVYLKTDRLVVLRNTGLSGHIVTIPTGSSTSYRMEGFLIANQATADAVTITLADDTIAHTGHPFVDGDHMTFWDLTGGGPLATGVIYYVRDSVAGVSYKLSATLGGGAIDITADGTGSVQRYAAVYQSGNSVSTFNGCSILGQGRPAVIIGTGGSSFMTLENTAVSVGEPYGLYMKSGASVTLSYGTSVSASGGSILIDAYVGPGSTLRYGSTLWSYNGPSGPGTHILTFQDYNLKNSSSMVGSSIKDALNTAYTHSVNTSNPHAVSAAQAGSVAADGLAKITVSGSAPVAPATGDIWISQSGTTIFTTGPQTLDSTHQDVICNSGAGFTVNLPNAAASLVGIVYNIKNIGAGNTSVAAGVAIDASSPKTLTQWQSLTVKLVDLGAATYIWITL